jgi:hypothetical protein
MQGVIFFLPNWSTEKVEEQFEKKRKQALLHSRAMQEKDLSGVSLLSYA